MRTSTARFGELRSKMTTESCFAALTIPQLARLWLDQKRKPIEHQDAAFTALEDYERKLLRESPDRIIDLILEILKTEATSDTLCLLEAGLVQDVIEERTIERIEREAAGNWMFRSLLRGASYAMQGELKRRIDAIVQGRPRSRP